MVSEKEGNEVIIICKKWTNNWRERGIDNGGAKRRIYNWRRRGEVERRNEEITEEEDKGRK